MPDIKGEKRRWREHVGNIANHKDTFVSLAVLWLTVIGAMFLLSGLFNGRTPNVVLILIVSIIYLGVPLIFLVYGISWIYFWRGEKLLKYFGTSVPHFIGPWRLFDSWASGHQRKKMNLYISVLSAMPGSELGMLVASATDLKNKMVCNGVADVSDPYILTEKMPMITFEFSKRVIKLQKKKRFEDAAALMVWVHTLRAASRPELRGLGRRMWGELERGFPFVQCAAEGAYDLMGVQFNVDGYNEFPIGLEPIIPA